MLTIRDELKRAELALELEANEISIDPSDETSSDTSDDDKLRDGRAKDEL